MTSFLVSMSKELAQRGSKKKMIAIIVYNHKGILACTSCTIYVSQQGILRYVPKQNLRPAIRKKTTRPSPCMHDHPPWRRQLSYRECCHRPPGLIRLGNCLTHHIRQVEVHMTMTTTCSLFWKTHYREEESGPGWTRDGCGHSGEAHEQKHLAKGITKLQDRWNNVIACNGDYFWMMMLVC